MTAGNDEIQSTIRPVLARYPEIKLAILFGSAGSGRLRPESDIDLGVAGERPLSVQTRFRMIGDLGSVLGRPVDLIDLAVTGGPVLMEVLRGRVILRHDSALFARMMRRAWEWDADIAPVWRRTVRERNARFFG